LVESELFGHARGAFTGADRERAGAFESAHGGTVFLDEIGELPLELQPKLLRALEAREIRRVGEVHPRKVDVRVVAATNRSLEKEVNLRRFREDLYYRLSVISVRVPPLRERVDDIDLLVRVFLDLFGAAEADDLFTPDVLAGLRAHSWPGNVRELKNVVERVVVFRDGSPAKGLGSRRGENLDKPEFLPYREAKARAIDAFEKAYLGELLEWANGNLSRAARRAQMDRMNLHRLAQRFGLREGRGLRD
jgi:transcriptional regulator with GAF, ATPase, and Fis domain